MIIGFYLYLHNRHQSGSALFNIFISPIWKFD